MTELYHFTNEQTLDLIKQTDKIWFTALETYSIKSGADDQEFKFGIKVLCELLEEELVIREYTDDVRVSLREAIEQTISAEELYRTSIEGSEGTWGVLSCTNNSKNEYVHVKYGKSCNKKLSINIDKFKMLIEPLHIIKIHYFNSIKETRSILEDEIEVIADLVVKLSELKSRHREITELGKEVSLSLIKKVILFSLRIKRTCFDGDFFYREKEIRLVSFLPKTHPHICYLLDTHGNKYFSIPITEEIYSVEPF